MNEKSILDNFIENEKKYSFLPRKILNLAYSIILVTRNRAPYPAEKYFKNPLSWCFNSIVNQEVQPSEIVIVNDASFQPPVDFTDEMIGIFRKKCLIRKIKLIYRKNSKRKNVALARNIGVKLANYDTLLFLDDDTVARKKSSWGVLLFDWLKDQDPKTFVLNLPLNNRSSHPLILVPAKNIGSINESNLTVTSNLITRFPGEYLDPQKLINKEGIIKPLKLQNFQGGFFITDKRKFLSVGGFSDFGSPISYGEETALALKGLKMGYAVYYFPYNNLAGVHLSYGNPYGRQYFIGQDWLANRGGGDLTLNEMVKESIIERGNTGIRTSKEYYFYIKIRNLEIVFSQVRKDLAQKWIKKSYQSFVEKNDDLFLDKKGKIEDKKTRKKIWQYAVEHAKKKKCFSEKELLIKLKGSDEA